MYDVLCWWATSNVGSTVARLLYHSVTYCVVLYSCNIIVVVKVARVPLFAASAFERGCPFGGVSDGRRRRRMTIPSDVRYSPTFLESDAWQFRIPIGTRLPPWCPERGQCALDVPARIGDEDDALLFFD